MSREQRRSTLGSARSRRTPAAPAGGGGSRIPLAPFIVVLGVAAVVGLMGYLIWQQTKPASTSDAAAQAAEADADPDLPGEWVDVASVHGGPYPDNAPHVTREIDFVEAGNSNPPAGGPMWGSAGCTDDPEDSPAYCGAAPSGFFTKPWAPETLNHNMEHAGFVVWYNTNDQTMIDDLRDFAEDNRARFLVVSPFPAMEGETVAITAWSRIDKFPISEYSKERLEDFMDAHECRFDPEGFC